jgi:hypothetical protein
MKRHVCIVVTFAILVTLAVGCRRRAPVARKPVEVYWEKDYILAPSEEELLKIIKGKKFEIDAEKRWLNNLAPDLQEQFLAIQDQEKKDKAKDNINKINEERNAKTELEAAEKELQEFAKAYHAFHLANEEDPKAHSLDKLQTYLRRQGLLEVRRAVDTDKIKVVLEVDWKVKGQITGHRVDNKQGANYTAVVPEGTIYKKQEDVKREIQEQELTLLYKQYREYKTAAGTELDYEALCKHLVDNAPPSLAATVIEGRLLIRDFAPAKKKPIWFACRPTEESQNKGHLGISEAGKIGYIPADEVRKSFPKREKQ